MERVRRRQVSRAIWFGVVAWLIGNGGGILVEFLDVPTFRPEDISLAVTAVSLVVALGSVWGGARVEHRGVPVPVAVFLVLLLCGAGGAAATYGVQRGVREARLYLDPASVRSTQRLSEQETHTDGSLTVIVTSVEVSTRFTVVRMLASNASDETLRLPVGGFTEFRLPDGTTFPGDPRTSRWPEAVPPQGTIGGFIVFSGVPGPNATTASVGFTQVFSERGPRSITVPLRLAELTVR